LTKHDEDIPRDPFDCLDLRNAPDGKGPLAKAGKPDQYFVVDPETGQRAQVRQDPDGTYIASTTKSGDVQIQQNPDDQKWYPVDTETGELTKDPATGELTGGMDAQVVKGEPGGRGDPKLVKQLQMFLVTLGFELGKTGPTKDGVDGAFGEKTDKAVKDFQGQNTDFNGEQLKQDGKVGPKTSDALNRAMVGVSNDDDIDIEGYLTPPQLTKDSRFLLLTSTRAGLKQTAVIGPEFGDKVAPNFDKLTLVLVD
jgi:peptidoglycan hydrolase-like protein with peptidoglycan-binding domain